MPNWNKSALHSKGSVYPRPAFCSTPWLSPRRVVLQLRYLFPAENALSRERRTWKLWRRDNQLRPWGIKKSQDCLDEYIKRVWRAQGTCWNLQSRWNNKRKFTFHPVEQILGIRGPLFTISSVVSPLRTLLKAHLQNFQLSFRDSFSTKQLSEKKSGWKGGLKRSFHWRC